VLATGGSGDEAKRVGANREVGKYEIKDVKR
jgi:hypothetical protein